MKHFARMYRIFLTFDTIDVLQLFSKNLGSNNTIYRFRSNCLRSLDITLFCAEI